MTGCCAACVANASCASWTVPRHPATVDGPQAACHLKHGVPRDGGEASPGSTSGIVRQPVPLLAAAATGFWGALAAASACTSSA